MSKRQTKPQVRHRLLVLLFLVIAINYLDRSSLSVAAPHIRDEFGLSDVQLGLLFSIFSWSYVAMQLPAGWLLDRLGPKMAYGWALVCWSFFTATLALSRNLGTLLGLRLALGAAEAPAFPANSKLVSNWFPAAERGRATATWICGQYAGLAIALPLLTWIIALAGWRVMFLATGIAGLALAVFWFRHAHDEPRLHPAISEEELNHIGSALPTDQAQPRARASWADFRYLLGQRRLWGMYVGNFCSNSALSFFLTWFPSYLTKEKGISFSQAGWLGMIPYMAALVGVLVSGTLSDRLLRSGLSPAFARKAPLIGGYMLATTIFLANFTSDPAIVVAIMSIAFFGQGTSGISWTIFSDVAPLRMIGLAGGMFNFFTGLGAIVTPLVIGVIVGQTGSFAPALMFIAILAAIGMFSYLFVVDRVERLVPPDDTGCKGVI